MAASKPGCSPRVVDQAQVLANAAAGLSWVRELMTLTRTVSRAAESVDGVAPPLGSTHPVRAKEAPARTDEGTEAVAYLQVRDRIHEPEAKEMRRAEMCEFLPAQYGPICQERAREFGDSSHPRHDQHALGGCRPEACLEPGLAVPAVQPAQSHMTPSAACGA